MWIWLLRFVLGISCSFFAVCIYWWKWFNSWCPVSGIFQAGGNSIVMRENVILNLKRNYTLHFSEKKLHFTLQFKKKLHFSENYACLENSTDWTSAHVSFFPRCPVKHLELLWCSICQAPEFSSPPPSLAVGSLKCSVDYIKMWNSQWSDSNLLKEIRSLAVTLVSAVY